MADATLNTPRTRPSEAKYLVSGFSVSRLPAQAIITAAVVDASDADIRTETFIAPHPQFPTATLNGFLTAIGTARSGESGTVANRANYRVLGFLIDNGYIAGATLNA